MRISTQSHLLRRLSLWMLGQALPETGALRAPARKALISVVVASAAGTLVALGVVAALIGLYLYLVKEGLSEGASVALVGGLGLMAGFIAYLIAAKSVEKIPDHLEELKLFRPHNQDLLGDVFNLIVGGFLEGMSDNEEKEKRIAKGKKTRAEIQATIDDLLASLDALEEDTEEAVQEATEEVVLEIEKHVPRRKARRKTS